MNLKALENQDLTSNSFPNISKLTSVPHHVSPERLEVDYSPAKNLSSTPSLVGPISDTKGTVNISVNYFSMPPPSFGFPGYPPVGLGMGPNFPGLGMPPQYPGAYGTAPSFPPLLFNNPTIDHGPLNQRPLVPPLIE